jgi:hypothetical protein
MSGKFTQRYSSYAVPCECEDRTITGRWTSATGDDARSSKTLYPVSGGGWARLHRRGDPLYVIKCLQNQVYCRPHAYRQSSFPRSLPPCSLARSLPPYRQGVLLDIVFMHTSSSNMRRVPFVRKAVKGRGNAFELCSCFTTCGERIEGLTIGELASCSCDNSTFIFRMSFAGNVIDNMVIGGPAHGKAIAKGDRIKSVNGGRAVPQIILSPIPSSNTHAYNARTEKHTQIFRRLLKRKTIYLQLTKAQIIPLKLTKT